MHIAELIEDFTMLIAVALYIRFRAFTPSQQNLNAFLVECQRSFTSGKGIVTQYSAGLVGVSDLPNFT